MKIARVLSLMVLLLSGCALELFAQQPFFIRRREFRSGEGPIAVALARLRGPTMPYDLAVVSAFTDDLRIFFGDGRGGFRLDRTYTGLSNPFYVLARDLNNDGVLDLVVANYFASPPYISVFLGDRNNPGRFLPRSDYIVAHWNSAIAAADFNNDGYLDLAVATLGEFFGDIRGCDQPCRSNNTISVLINNRDGTFGSRQDIPVGCAPEGIAVGDLNGDGNMDIATANLFSCSMTVLFGDGTGNFPTRSDLPVGERPSTAVIADFNNDGNPDLATINEISNTVSVLLGNGLGGFSAPLDCGIPGGLRIVDVDIDGDGIIDLIAAGGIFNKGFPLLSDGTGRFVGCPIPNTVPPAFDTGPIAANLASADINGDGIPDIAAANKGAFEAPGIGSVTTSSGDGYGNFGLFYGLATTPLHVATADFNNDGYLDLAIANVNDNSVRVLLGDGLTGFTGMGNMAVQSRPVAVATGRFRGPSSSLDLVVANFGSDSISVLLGNGNGTFQTAIHTAVGARMPNSIVVADFDCDGKQDVAIANAASNNVRILYGNGNGTFTRTRTLTTAGMLEPIWLTKADFRGNGRTDLAVVNRTSNNISIFLADGCSPSSGFTAVANVPLPVGANASWISAGDFDGDGKSDLAVANTGLNTVSVFVGNGDGTFRFRNDLTAGTSPVSLTIADYNWDGKADLAIANIGSNNVSVYLGDGRGFFTPATASPFFAGLGPVAMVTGNFDNATGDTRPDLATVNWGSNVVSILLNNGP